MRGRRAQHGFTIIEVMLVLGISGMMMMGILVSVNAGISGQRYKDSANSVVDYFQGQYSEVTNTRNNRPLDKTCDGAGVQDNPAGDAYRGTTDCTIIGRVLRGDGAEIVSSPVYTIVDVLTLLSESDEMALLASANPIEGTESSDTYTLEWGARLTPTGGSDVPQKFTIAIIRSPGSGNIHTFADTSSNLTTITDLTSNTSFLASDTEFCVSPAGGIASVTSAALGVKIAKDSPSPSGVQLIAQGGSC